MAVASPSYSMKISIDFPRHSPRGGERDRNWKNDFFVPEVEKMERKKTIFHISLEILPFSENKVFLKFYIGKIYILNQFLLSPNVRQVNNTN